MSIRTQLTSLAAFAILACGGPMPAYAALIDLRNAPVAVDVDGAIYETSDFRTAGTGVIRSFVRIQANNIEQGYNTSARPVPFNELRSANFTRDLQINQLGTQVINGVGYVLFSLDANQATGNGRFISLDKVKIFISPTNGHKSPDLSTLGTLIYDLDAVQNHSVLIDAAINSGSGQGDMKLYVPMSLFTPFPLESYVTLYSQFGDIFPSNSGFEEWSTLGDPFPIPEPASLGFLSCAAALLRRR